MKLYKYVSSEIALTNIASGRIKFATLDSLNDPTELLPKIYEIELLESLRRIRTIGYDEDDLIDLKRQELIFQKLSPETMVIPAPESIEIANSIVNLPVYNNLEYLKRMFHQTVEFMSLRCGIFCVSTRYDSLPMWAHYAENASGFVIEFEDLHHTFSGDGTGILDEISSVQYKVKRSGINFEKGSYKSLFFEKDKDWEYESEKRVITDLKSCKKIGTDNGDIFIKEINKNHISRVIFGWKVPNQNVKKLSQKISSINPKAQITVAKIENGLIEI